MEIQKENMLNTETKMVSTENSLRVIKHFETMSFMPTQKAVNCHLPRSRGVIKQMINYQTVQFQCLHIIYIRNI